MKAAVFEEPKFSNLSTQSDTYTIEESESFHNNSKGDIPD
jgi:hypothetical protein